jgi:hypothetical protein
VEAGDEENILGVLNKMPDAMVGRVDAQQAVGLVVLELRRVVWTGAELVQWMGGQGKSQKSRCQCRIIDDQKYYQQEVVFTRSHF